MFGWIWWFFVVSCFRLLVLGWCRLKLVLFVFIVLVMCLLVIVDVSVWVRRSVSSMFGLCVSCDCVLVLFGNFG